MWGMTIFEKLPINYTYTAGTVQGQSVEYNGALQQNDISNVNTYIWNFEHFRTRMKV